MKLKEENEILINLYMIILILQNIANITFIIQFQQLIIQKLVKNSMLNRSFLILKFFARRVKPQPITKPEGAENVKFTEEQLSRMGQASANARVTIGEAFKQKYQQDKQELDQHMQRKRLKMGEKKTDQTRKKELYNKQMPKHLNKQDRITPQQMSLQDLSSVRLGPQFLPVSYLKQAQKIFHKYGQTRLRQISTNFSKLMSLRYSEQKLDFEAYQNLKYQRLQLKLPKEKEVEQIYLIGQQKIYKDQQPAQKDKRKIDNQTFTPEMSYTQNVTISYLLNRAPRTFSTAIRLLNQLKYKYPNFKPSSFLDFGGGLSAGSTAFIDVFQDSGEVYSVEPSAKMRKLSKFLTDGMKIKYYQSLGEMSSQVKQVDIVYAGYVINQLKPDLVQVYLEALYTKTKNEGFLILVEHGSPFGSRLIHEARKWAIQKGMQIAAPCPHQLKCPLAKQKRWCHFDQPSGIYPQNVFGKLPTDQAIKYEKFSYLILQKKQLDSQISEIEKNQPNITKEWDRVIYPILRRGRHVIVDLCTKQGLFQRRICAKSHGPQYKEAKKLRWGDYWRFGKRIPNKYRKQRKTGKRLW